MKHYLKPCIALIFISVLIISGFSSLTFAETAPKTIQLNLNQPPQKQDEQEKEEDLFTEKYQEVMSEISISEEAAMVVDQIKLAVEDVRDLSLEAQVSEIRGQRNEVVVFHLLGSIEEKIARLEFKEPSALRGMIMVADQGKMELRIFQPVVNMITVQTLEDASKEALSALNIAQLTTELTTYFDFSQYNVEVLEVVTTDGVSDYLLEVDAPDEQVWQVRVKDDSWVPYEITVFEGETLLGKMSMSNIELNPELTTEQLMELPKVKEERI
ncbi:MAG: hypothetical protein GX971_12035 [Firmicutes bacterium]|nr:hypothetical protein [Bacillota bacterium]